MIPAQSLTHLRVSLYPFWEHDIVLHVRIIARSTLARFVEGLAGNKDHRAVKVALDSWFHEVRQADWKNSSDIKANYAHAIIVGADRVVFNIKGNSYRLVTAVDYRGAIVFIKWLGTHKEYDSIDVRTVHYASETNQD
jgi:mRNA interferase HigB